MKTLRYASAMRVRLGNVGDIDWLVSQVKLFSEFFGTKRPLFSNEEYAREGLLKTMQEHILFVATHNDGTPVGFVAGYIIPHMFNPEISVLAETFWWVQPEYRGTRAGLMLLNELVAYGKEHTDWILMALEDGSPVNEKCLTKRGFVLKERNYLLEVS